MSIEEEFCTRGWADLRLHRGQSKIDFIGGRELVISTDFITVLYHLITTVSGVNGSPIQGSQDVSPPRRFPPSRFASIFHPSRFAPNTLDVSPPIPFPP